MQSAVTLSLLVQNSRPEDVRSVPNPDRPDWTSGPLAKRETTCIWHAWNRKESRRNRRWCSSINMDKDNSSLSMLYRNIYLCLFVAEYSLLAASARFAIILYIYIDIIYIYIYVYRYYVCIYIYIYSIDIFEIVYLLLLIESHWLATTWLNFTKVCKNGVPLPSYASNGPWGHWSIRGIAGSSRSVCGASLCFAGRQPAMVRLPTGWPQRPQLSKVRWVPAKLQVFAAILKPLQSGILELPTQSVRIQRKHISHFAFCLADCECMSRSLWVSVN